MSGSLTVAGQHRSQHQLAAVLQHDRNGRDKRGQSLSRGAHQSFADSRQVGHNRKRLLVSDIAEQRFGGRDGGGAGPVAQQRDLAHDHAGADFVDHHRVIVSGVADLGPAGLDQNEGHRLLALAHQHLAGGGPQWPQTLGDGMDLFVRTVLEQLHIAESADTRARRLPALGRHRLNLAMVTSRPED